MASQFFNGYQSFGQDFTKQVFNSYVDFSPSTTGVLQSNAQGVISAGDVYHNFSGVAGKPCVYIVSNQVSPAFTVTDLFGGAAGSNIILSGAPGTSYTFNGATTFTLSTAYGRKDVVLATGILQSGIGSWIAY